MIRVIKVKNNNDLERAYKIRKQVFVEEQMVPLEDELDAYEEVSEHFLALDNEDEACGAARWRFTEEGVKLERFAVLNSHRAKGVGTALVEAVLKDIKTNPNTKGSKYYLHAQMDAVPLYRKFGFETVGPEFVECGITHKKMIKL